MAIKYSWEERQRCPVCGGLFYDSCYPDGVTVGDYWLCEPCLSDPGVIAAVKEIEREYAANPPSFLRGLFLSPIRSRIAAEMRTRKQRSINKSEQVVNRRKFAGKR